MWKDKLEKIKIKFETDYGDSFNNPATDNEISKLKNSFLKKFGLELPTQYLEFLKYMNGVEFDGFIIFSIDKDILDNDTNQQVEGIINFNEILYENEFNKDYIFLADSDISWYVYNVKDKNFNILDKPSGELMETYEDFYSMLDNVLEEYILNNL